MQDPIAVELSRSLRSSSVRQAIAPTLARVERELSTRPDEPQAWEPVSLGTLGFDTPSDTRSCWVFVLRAGATFGAERHPNSHQRTIALSGAALFEVFVDGRWSPWPISGEKSPGQQFPSHLRCGIGYRSAQRTSLASRFTPSLPTSSLRKRRSEMIFHSQSNGSIMPDPCSSGRRTESIA